MRWGKERKREGCFARFVKLADAQKSIPHLLFSSTHKTGQQPRAARAAHTDALRHVNPGRYGSVLLGGLLSFGTKQNERQATSRKQKCKKQKGKKLKSKSKKHGRESKRERAKAIKQNAKGEKQKSQKH